MVYYPEDKMIHRLSFLARFRFNKPDISRHDIPSFVLMSWPRDFGMTFLQG